MVKPLLNILGAQKNTPFSCSLLLHNHIFSVQYILSKNRFDRTVQTGQSKHCQPPVSSEPKLNCIKATISESKISPYMSQSLI